MKKILTLLLMVTALFPVSAQEKLKLEDVMGGKYSAQSIYGWNPSRDGESFLQITDGGTKIQRYSFRTGELVETVFDVNTARNVKLQRINGYIVSPTEDNILIQTERKAIYRHSSTAVYYIYNIKNRTLTPLSKNGF